MLDFDVMKGRYKIADKILETEEFKIQFEVSRPYHFVCAQKRFVWLRHVTSSHDASL